jgi:DNA-binding Lrp family transcriptional regulator
MISALVLLTTERDRINPIATELVDIEGISEVFSLAGRYDLAVMIRVANNQKLADIVTRDMLSVEGILTSETLIAFQVHSKHDLESMFSIGT